MGLFRASGPDEFGIGNNGISDITFNGLTIKTRYIEYFGYDAFDRGDQYPGERLFASSRYILLNEMI